MNTDVINIGCSDSEEEVEVPRNGRVTRSSTKRTKQKRNNSYQKKKNDTAPSLDNDIMVIEDDTKSEKKTKKVVLEDGLEVTIDDDSDEEMEQCIRVVWSQNAEVNRFNLKPSDPITSLFEFFSKKYDVPIENVKIMNGDNVVSKYESIKDIGLRITDTLEAYAVKENQDEDYKKNAPGKVEIKCLLQKLKKPLVFYLYNQQSISCILPECAKEASCSVNNIILKFDGEKVEPAETPITLALDGGECFEVHIKS